MRGGGDLGERGPFQRRDLRRGRRVLEQQHPSAGWNPSATPSAPGPAELGEIALTVADGNSPTVAVYQEEHSPTRLDPGMIPHQLRRVVAGGDMAWQRVVWQGRPILIIGAPLLIVERDRTTRLSGIEGYTAISLSPEQLSIDQLAVRAWLTDGAALAFAVVLALPAIRGVLRPVRELGRVARLPIYTGPTWDAYKDLLADIHAGPSDS
ncbi:hypothetical protein ACQEVF_45870 [Nonomuraea polychroma]|uniref:hypothetical protein n=1 Tax=Nonomuraea polychroma TaxID=46176 RepID=UPI003D917A00